MDEEASIAIAKLVISSASNTAIPDDDTPNTHSHHAKEPTDISDNNSAFRFNVLASSTAYNNSQSTPTTTTTTSSSIDTPSSLLTPLNVTMDASGLEIVSPILPESVTKLLYAVPEAPLPFEQTPRQLVPLKVLADNAAIAAGALLSANTGSSSTLPTPLPIPNVHGDIGIGGLAGMKTAASSQTSLRGMGSCESITEVDEEFEGEGFDNKTRIRDGSPSQVIPIQSFANSGNSSKLLQQSLSVTTTETNNNNNNGTIDPLNSSDPSTSPPQASSKHTWSLFSAIRKSPFHLASFLFNRSESTATSPEAHDSEIQTHPHPLTTKQISGGINLNTSTNNTPLPTTCSHTPQITQNEPINSIPLAYKKFITIENLLSNNRKWARAMVGARPDFFLRLANQQSPQCLWVGCSDSRVPANQIISLEPGEVFVHRNVANIISHSDVNALSALQYAVDVLKVRHVIVCGHYGCGGVLASMSNRQYGLIDNWLRYLKDIYQGHSEVLDKLPEGPERADLMCELNVVHSVKNICVTTIVQNAWARGQQVDVHGWCYRLTDGIIRDLGIRISGPGQLSNIYRFLDDKDKPMS